MRNLSAVLVVCVVGGGCGESAAPTGAPPITITVEDPSLPFFESLPDPTLIEPPPGLKGSRPPEWAVAGWVNTEPLRLADLTGKVVLVRWFTGSWCQDCTATAPALRGFDAKYRDRGLAVIGMFHNSDSATADEVLEIAREYQYRFPIALDRKAETRRLWCGGEREPGFTSATFILDRSGAIRYTHPGGRYVASDSDYVTIEAAITELLAEEPFDFGYNVE